MKITIKRKTDTINCKTKLFDVPIGSFAVDIRNFVWFRITYSAVCLNSYGNTYPQIQQNTPLLVDVLPTGTIILIETGK
jgi:hypothetical protein